MNASPPELWPDLPYERCQETCATLHLWTQVVGKSIVELHRGRFLRKQAGSR